MESITKHFIYMEIGEAPVLIHIFAVFLFLPAATHVLSGSVSL